MISYVEIKGGILRGSLIPTWYLKSSGFLHGNQMEGSYADPKYLRGIFNMVSYVETKGGILRGFQTPTRCLNYDFLHGDPSGDPWRILDTMVPVRCCCWFSFLFLFFLA